MIKVKICGITNTEDAIYSCQFGAWALGFIFVKSSPRYISPEKAAQIIKSLPVNIQKIGVFADLSIKEIIDFAEIAGITKIQLHGSENPEFCKKLSQNTELPLIKALRIKNIKDINTIKDYTDGIELILLDSYSCTELGGTGEIFDWEIANQAKKLDKPIILAGGITPDNILTAYNKTQPYAIDLSSGVEKEKGIKDHSKLKQLFSQAKEI